MSYVQENYQIDEVRSSHTFKEFADINADNHFDNTWVLVDSDSPNITGKFQFKCNFVVDLPDVTT